ncbi:hypothetical protein HGRIS_013434 [Hohenbuehelia grisea]|uniref:Uncharacterized protein n=1 Tax=Hohenbuehelia grisea TaxID=104357 RepID=A0ABR3IVD1_9AGAR
MPAVDLTSPTAPPTFNTTALFIALGVGVGVLGVCGALYKSLCLLLNWMDSKIEEKVDLESQLSKVRPFTIDLRRPEAALLASRYAPDIPDVGPLRPIIPPYLSFVPPPPPTYTSEISYSPPADISITSSSYSFETICLGSSSSIKDIPYIDEIVIAPFQSPDLSITEPISVFSKEVLVISEPFLHQELDSSDSGANLSAILGRIEELESSRIPFAPLFQLGGGSSGGIPQMKTFLANIVDVDNSVQATPSKGPMRGRMSAIPLPKPKTPARRAEKIFGGNKENIRRCPSYMSPTAASRIRHSATGNGRRVL